MLQRGLDARPALLHPFVLMLGYQADSAAREGEIS